MIKIPTHLPSTSAVAAALNLHLRSRWMSLGGMRPLGDILTPDCPGWVVGSNVWRLVVGLSPVVDSDLDIVFENESDRSQAIARMKKWHDEFRGSPWSFDGVGYGDKTRRVMNANVVLVDTWICPADLTMEEHVLSFSEEHQRCALRPDGTIFRGIRRGKAPGAK